MVFKATKQDEITKRIRVEREQVKSTTGGPSTSTTKYLWGTPKLSRAREMRQNHKGDQEGTARKVGGKSVKSGVLEAK